MARVLRCDGSRGSCLFVALRLGLEIHHTLDAIAKNSFKTTNLNGFHPVVTASAEDLRRLICKWYSTSLDRPVPALGNYEERNAVTEARQWVRQDLLAVEMVRTGQDVPQTGPERTRKALEYIRALEGGKWGGTPEYTAFALLAQLHIEVYEPGKADGDFPGLMRVDHIRLPEAKGTIRLLYNGANHYDLLVDRATVDTLQTVAPSAKFESF